MRIMVNIYFWWGSLSQTEDLAHQQKMRPKAETIYDTTGDVNFRCKKLSADTVPQSVLMPINMPPTRQNGDNWSLYYGDQANSEKQVKPFLKLRIRVVRKRESRSSCLVVRGRFSGSSSGALQSASGGWHSWEGDGRYYNPHFTNWESGP